eukprot:243585-Amphidinium_carterae.2
MVIKDLQWRARGGSHLPVNPPSPLIIPAFDTVPRLRGAARCGSCDQASGSSTVPSQGNHPGGLTDSPRSPGDIEAQ